MEVLGKFCNYIVQFYIIIIVKYYNILYVKFGGKDFFIVNEVDGCDIG